MSIRDEVIVRLQREVDEKDARIKELEEGLTQAIKLIRGWHSMGMPKDQEQIMWDVYNNQSPEMKRLKALFI